MITGVKFIFYYFNLLVFGLFFWVLLGNTGWDMEFGY